MSRSQAVPLSVQELEWAAAWLRVATRYPADRWPGEPLPSGERVACRVCRQEVDTCDVDGGLCLDCGLLLRLPTW